MVKKATFLPAPPRRTKTRLIPGETAVSCENEAGGFLTTLLWKNGDDTDRSPRPVGDFHRESQEAAA